ncbi:MAG TPA: hypothetical protein EYP43_02860 [Thermoplasmata archaeon]|nr:hypothetical protein [Thermoplasmata archaeon]
MRKIPIIYLFMVGVLLSIMAVLILWFVGVIKTESIITDILIILVQWVFITGLALLGAILLGMFLGHRFLSIRGFTPFEKEMLEMHSNIKAMNARLDSIQSDIEAIRKALEER